MRRRALSKLALAKALGEGVAHTTVARWLEGSRPRGAIANRLADYFGVPVDLLLDDARDLPAEYDTARVEEEQREHLVSAPLATAAHLAGFVGGSAEARQASFEVYLGQIRAMREEAEKLAGGELATAVAIFDRMLATWLAAQQALPAKEADALKKISDDASRVIHGLSPKDPEWRAALEKLIELRNREAHPQREEKNRHAS